MQGPPPNASTQARGGELVETGLVTLGRLQAANGQIPKFVDLRRQEADFWYLGCIDATLWWLVALDFLDRRDQAGGLRERLPPGGPEGRPGAGGPEAPGLFSPAG